MIGDEDLWTLPGHKKGGWWSEEEMPRGAQVLQDEKKGASRQETARRLHLEKFTRVKQIRDQYYAKQFSALLRLLAETEAEEERPGHVTVTIPTPVWEKLCAHPEYGRERAWLAEEAEESEKAEKAERQRRDDVVRDQAGNAGNTDLRDCGLSMKVLNILMRVGVRTLEELLATREEDLAKNRGMGPKALAELRSLRSLLETQRPDPAFPFHALRSRR